MNTWQVVKQLKYLLETLKWSVGGEDVFGSVHITPSAPAEVVVKYRFPVCLINVLSSTSDPEAPDLITEAVQVTVITKLDGDATGQNAMIGANKSGGDTSSKGRGILEIQEKVLDQIQYLGRTDGVIGVHVRSISAAAGELIAGLGYVSARKFNLDAIVGTVKTLTQAANFTATPIGGGQVNLAWTLPPFSYGFDSAGPWGSMVLRRVPGAVPTTSPTGGTGVTLSGSFAVAATATPGAGTFSYSLFVGYDEDQNGTVDSYSSPRTLTTVVT